MNDHQLEIISFDKIKISVNKDNFRHVLLKDLNNSKTVDFIFFEKKYPFIWEAISNNEPKTAYLPGKIITIQVTKELIDKISFDKLPVYKEDQFIDIVVWNWPEWSRISETVKQEWSFKEQLWKIKDYFQQKRIITGFERKDDEDYDKPHKNWERDYFDAMTDGTMDDYDDYNDNIDDFTDNLGR